MRVRSRHRLRRDVLRARAGSVRATRPFRREERRWYRRGKRYFNVWIAERLLEALGLGGLL